MLIPPLFHIACVYGPCELLSVSEASVEFLVENLKCLACTWDKKLEESQSLRGSAHPPMSEMSD